MALSGQNRIKVGEITQGKLRGKAMSDALAKALNNQGSTNEAP